MDKSVARLNIEHYQKLLKTDLDETKRRTILRLLSEEEATLARLNSAAKTELTKTPPTKPTATKPTATKPTATKTDAIETDTAETDASKIDAGKDAS
ncbi:hypothetical protein [Rhodopseudomonas palustris]|uniref:Uncharacterized protein n=1 Tax=Rhodopseudomonas palustris (strain BisB18) TaxID=316056 RepID=Q218T0_RHOPB